MTLYTKSMSNNQCFITSSNFIYYIFCLLTVKLAVIQVPEKYQLFIEFLGKFIVMQQSALTLFLSLRMNPYEFTENEAY